MVMSNRTYRDMNGIAIKAKDVYLGDENLEDRLSRTSIKYPLHKYFVSESYKFSGDGYIASSAGYACVIQEPLDYNPSLQSIGGLKLSLSTLFQVYLDSDSKSDIPISHMIIGIPSKLINLLPPEKRIIEIINYHTLFKYVRDTVLSLKRNSTLEVRIVVIEEENENINMIKTPYGALKEADPSDSFLGYEHTYRGFKSDGPSSKPGIKDCFAYTRPNRDIGLIAIQGEYETNGTCTLYGSLMPTGDLIHYFDLEVSWFKININLQFINGYDEIKDNGQGILGNKYSENPVYDWAIYYFDSESDYKLGTIGPNGPNGPSAVSHFIAKSRPDYPQFILKSNCPIHYLGLIDNQFINLDYYDMQSSDYTDYSKRKKSMTIKVNSDTCDDILGKFEMQHIELE